MERLRGILGSSGTISGKLANAALRGMSVQIQVVGTKLQWKYEDEDTWKDLIDLNEIDYEALNNLPVINGEKFMGDMSEAIMTPGDELSNAEISQILRH